ncbi:hypothetical protein HY572_06110 [Candidatus Micrarchaeota archaeon]|nr:hypothetical protein [Candidatus Micrarchaeota archaeon]
MDYTNAFTQGLVLLASLGFLAAVYYTYRLSQETKGEKYWTFFLVAALALAMPYWLSVPHDLNLIPTGTTTAIGEVAAIAGALSLAYASHGLYQTMKRIRKRVE